MKAIVQDKQLMFNCSNCGKDVAAKDLLGRISDPFCEECWNTSWKGNEESYINKIIKSE